jgi:alkanesulfonate monooxygenase SsuD/methylene tetrahydromethanopterin reductase-like flavin-dependent oxidoreductase (luciferase family)
MPVQLGLFDIMQVDPLDPSGHDAVYRRRLADLAYADDLGFEFAFVAERHYLLHYRTPAPSAWIAAATQRTKRMRLGVLAYTLALHSPVRLAEEVAVLDHLSGGRIEVGVGLGHRVEELVANGVDPARRIPNFQERLAIMEGLWSGGRVSIDSEFNTYTDVAINPPPLQSPHPPLWYAGTDAGAASWAGQHGMSLAIGFAPLRDLVPATAGFRAGIKARREAGEIGPPLPGGGRIALMQHVYLAENDERARAEMADDLERLGALNPAAADQNREERKARARAERDRLLANDVFLAGGPETVAKGIRFAQRALGIDLYLANVYAGGVDDERVRRTLGRLANEVRPTLTADAG